MRDCFSLNLNPSYDQSMTEFRNNIIYLQEYLPSYNLELKISWKLHIVLSHVVPFCENQKCGLARFAEQAIKSVHPKFKSTWNRYKISSIHSGHGDALKNAVTSFSARRR